MLFLLKSVIIIFALLGICMLPVMGTEISQFDWIGKNSDKVGTWDNGNPDGSMDGHFRIDLTLPDQTEIRSILLYTADENAHPVGGQFWDTAATNYYILGVFDQGTQLNHNHVTTLDTFSGDVQFDLYAADSGWFEKGNWFGIEVTLGDGTKITRLTSIGASNTCDWNSFTPDQRAFIGQPGGVFPLDQSIPEGSYLIHVGPAGKFGLDTPATWNTFGPYNLRGGHKYRALIKSGPAGSSAGTSLPIDLQWDEDTADLLPYSNTEPGIARVFARNNVEGDIFYAICLTPAAGTGYPDLSGTWYGTDMRIPNVVGMPCKISQEGSTLTFDNGNGARSAGKFVDAKTVMATDWENSLHGTISADGNRIDWANGTWWTR